jgi:hypothetical protein
VLKNASSNNGRLSQKSKNEEKLQGYARRECDFKCYKCPHQGDCIIPRLIEARGLEIESEKTFLNSKYGLKKLAPILSLYERILRPVLSRLNRKIYVTKGNRNLENVYLNNRFRKYRRAKA